MIKLTLAEINGTIELNGNAIETVKTSGEGSHIYLSNASSIYVKESIFDVMQMIVNEKFEGGNANG